MIKQYKIYNLYSKSTKEMQNKFYNIFLQKIGKFSDINYIFEIFPNDFIKNNIDLLDLINEKIKSFFGLILREKDFNISYLIINKWISCNNDDEKKDSINDIINVLYKYPEFTINYYLFLLKSKESKDIFEKIKNYIISFFIENNKNGKIKENILIDVFKNSTDNDFRKSFLEKMNGKILKECDFYCKIYTKNFEFFKLFFQIYDKSMENYLKDVYYIQKSTETKNKIIDDLKNLNVTYNLICNLISDNNIFENKIKILDNTEGDKTFDELKKSMDICDKKFSKLELIMDYYNQFYRETKKHQIKLINTKLKNLHEKNISSIISEENIFKDDNDFNFEEALEDSKNIKYGNSKFFLSVYQKNKENWKETEDFLFKKSIENYNEVMTNIITLKEKNLKFFEIKYAYVILDVINIQNNNLEEEIEFTALEFKNLNKENYIKNDLLNDLINYSQKDKAIKLLEGIIRFLNLFIEIENIQSTEYTKEFENMLSIVKGEDVSKEKIKEIIDELYEKGFDIKNEDSLILFFKSVNKDAIIFIKTLKKEKLEIRNLNEFVVENAASELKTSDIDNLIYIVEFFEKIFDNKEIKNDQALIQYFVKEINSNPEYYMRLKSYQNIYGEIKRVYYLYIKNPEMTIEKIRNLISNSIVDIYIDESNFYFTYKIENLKENDNIKVKMKEEKNKLDSEGLEKLRNKVLLLFNNSKTLKDEKEEITHKMKISKEFIDLIDNISKLTGILNNLLLIGYPNIINFKLKVINSIVKDENDKELKDIIEDYKNKNEEFKKTLRISYEKFPLLRQFFGQQFIQLFEKIKRKEFNQILEISKDNENNKRKEEEEKKNKIIYHLINSVSLNKIKEIDIKYEYNKNINELENINQFIEKLFNYNNINMDQIFEKNRVKDYNLFPGLYRLVKTDDNNILNKNIINIYLNLTNNPPIINTILICNEITSYENIECFLYRAIFCDKPILFVISNIECLELSYVNGLIKTLKLLYKEKKNRKINSYLLFIYEKSGSGFSKFIEKLIPEKNILNYCFLNEPKKEYKNYEEFKNIIVYKSKYSGYGKSTEIKYKVKENKGNYYYLPIGGSIARDYLIDNLVNLNIDYKQIDKNYLHLDLSETDNFELMQEILFKLIILRFIDSRRNIYYLGYDIHFMIEIPNGIHEFDEKYNLLNIFENIYIDQLQPLRLEENIQIIGDSQIALVAEVLDFYMNKRIGLENINLNGEINKSSKECEKIINKFFEAENENYYQKMNFIKILSLQFKKFTENIYFNISNNDNNIFQLNTIINVRPIIISNLISLTKIFTKSPFDTILLRQNKNKIYYDKIKEDKAKEEEIEILADENNKQEIFSFEDIRPPLVFINGDGQSLSIISNEKENEFLRIMWNLENKKILNMNYDQLFEIAKYDKTNKILNNLIDYKNLSHEQFLEQIKKVFDLKKLSIEDLKKICEKLGNYIFVSDNFIKMIRILLNIQAKIPVILMGETGVGKTKLLEMLATLYGKGKNNWEKLNIHAGITDLKIKEFIDKITKKYNDKENKDEIVWIFFDEINTCNSLGLITEIFCFHSYLGKKINDNFIFLGACNPYRIITKKMKDSGLIYYNSKDKNELSNLVYTVNPLPNSLLNFIFDFGSLKPEDEKKYINNAIIDTLKRLKEKNVISDFCNNKDELDKIQKDIIESIVICHNFMRDKIDKSSVSLRELNRFNTFFEYFIKYFKVKDKDTLKKSLNMTLYLCYYLRLNNKEYKEELSEKLNVIFDDFLEIPENEVKRITNEMTIEKNGGIALNKPLRENLFTSFICIDNCVPLIIVGKPGTGKSLSFQILYNSLKGEYSSSNFFKEKGKLYRYYYQGSESSTSEGIENVFKKARKDKKENLKMNNNIITLVFFDEMGLAERSKKNPLKIIHFLLEEEKEEKEENEKEEDEDEVKKIPIPFLGISNWKLDAAKINRALSLSITDYEINDLKETAIAISEAIDKDIAAKNNYFFEILAKTYYEYLEINKPVNEYRDFHGNRDFYSLIKNSTRELIKRKDEINKDKKKVLTEIGLQSLDRNFGGIEGLNIKIKEKFKELYKPNYDHRIEIDKPINIFEIIKKNISDPNSRYLMLISEGIDGLDIVKYLLNSEKKSYIELIGSVYKKDLRNVRYSEEILNKIKYIMETNKILILKDLDIIYPSLYDLFNQNFIIMGEKKFARLSFEYAKLSSEVNKDFHIIVLIDKKKLKNLQIDPPFLNRFEKHVINFNMILEENDKEIAKEIYNYIELISSFNNNPNLKLDLKNLLINCKLNNIEGMIFKIKNNPNYYKSIKEEKLDYEEYKRNIISLVFETIVPTFCQDIIVSMIYSEIKQISYNDLVIEIYNKSAQFNFISFLQNVKQRKSIIYTFSKITDDIFEKDFSKENKEIKNNFGLFNKQKSTIYMSESIKSETNLINIIKSFSESEHKNLLIFRITEKDLDKINSINYIINNSENDYPELKKKLIVLIIHKQRNLIKKDKIYKEETSQLIPFYNNNYHQIFIDNLNGKENLNIFKIFQKGNDFFVEKFIFTSEFIKNKIFVIANYFNYNIIFETKEVNNRNNYAKLLTELITRNEFLQKLLIINLKKQGKNLKNYIRDIFLSDSLEIDDIDFIEVIKTKLEIIYSKFLLKIIYSSLNDNILNPFIINKEIDSLMISDKFKTSIINYFENKMNIQKNLKMRLNANEIMILNGLKIPGIDKIFNELIKNFEKDYDRFFQNEESLRQANIKGKEVLIKISEYKEKFETYKKNLMLNNNDILKAIINLNNEKILFEDYMIYYLNKYLGKNELKFPFNEKLMYFLKLLIQIKLNTFNDENNENNIQEPFEKLIIVLMFTQGYKNDIKELFDKYLEIVKYCDNFDEIMKNYFEEKKIKYEESTRNKSYTKIVNISMFNIIESYIRAILLYSRELIQIDKDKFYEYFRILPSIEISLQKINKKYFLFSKEIYNIRNIIKIEEAYKNNHEQFEKNYIRIIDNLLLQSTLFYGENYDKLYNTILELIEIFNETFNDKNENYCSLLFFILRQEYKNIYDDDIKNKLLTKFFENKLLLKYSKFFLAETLKDFKPLSVYDDEGKKKSKDKLIEIFIDIKNIKFEKIHNLLIILNEIDSKEFNEVLLYFFEGLCQNYFFSILKKHKNEYNEKCCQELLGELSLGYLQKAIQFLYENKNNKNNNIFKIYAISYIKSYLYFYVTINKNHYDKCFWNEINKVLHDKNKINEALINMRNIYILRLYYNTFQNFEQFINYNLPKKIPIMDDIFNRLDIEINNENYIFNENFITPKIYDVYRSTLQNYKGEKLYFELINNNFDIFYCYIVNKILPFQLGKNKIQVKLNMKEIYDTTKGVVKFEFPRKILYQYLLYNELFVSEILNKMPDKPLSQSDLEILLYSFRFILNTNENEKNFYYNLQLSNAQKYIDNNYIPGSFPIIDEYIKSYMILKDKLKLRKEIGYYICKDCGFLYEVENCTFPEEDENGNIPLCPNNHKIGGKDHVCYKKDYRVFYDITDFYKLKEKWCFNEMIPWFESFEALMNLQEFKKKVIDKKIKIQKGIIKNYEINYLEKLDFVRNMDIITFRLLNFILYSYIFFSFVLKSLTDKEVETYLIKDFKPNLFSIIKKDWELLDISLKEIGIKNVQTFLNMIFDKLMDMINSLESVDTIEKLNAFETKVNEYIISIISKNESIEKLNIDYQSLNQEMNNLSYNTLKEIIKSSFDPLEYDQLEYPDIQYYSVSSLQNYESFVNKFNSTKENEKKYFLINLLIQKDQEITQNSLKLKNIINLNKLGNILIDIFSYKISRDEAKKVKLIDKLPDIVELYNKITNNNILDDEFIKEFISPYIKSWNEISDKATQYKCLALKNENEKRKPLEITIESKLYYFLVDIGDQDGGMFLASAYENFIGWQNGIINLIIENSKRNGILNSYSAKLNEEISIQDATENDIINIDDNTYSYLEELIMNCSMRNIFTKNGKIDYKNYYDNIYNYDYIEIELAKLILRGVKKFKTNKMKYIIYKYEGFKGDKSSILIEYNEKFPKKELSVEEKKSIYEFIKYNNNNNLYQDISSSLQMIMNQIILDIYEQDTLIYDIIKNFPPFIILNEELKNLLRKEYEQKSKSFTINTLIPMFEYFEKLCWKEMKNHIAPDFKLELSGNDREYILDYFEQNKNNVNKVINRYNFTTALRQLISRYLISSRQESEFKSDVKLSSYIGREELWSKKEIKNDLFISEIFDICKETIKIGNSYNLYEILEGDKILKLELTDIFEEENKNNNNNKREEDKNIQDSDDNSSDSDKEEEEVDDRLDQI